MMAQSCALTKCVMSEENIPLYSGINHVRFIDAVHAGDTCKPSSRLAAHRNSLFLCHSILEADSKQCCMGELSFVILPRDVNDQKR